MRLLSNGKLGARFDAFCDATRELLTRVGDKWSVQIVATLGEGPLRFNELRRSTSGISQRVLTATLRSLERDGFVKRTVHATNPPQVEYALSGLGQKLLKSVSALAQWAEGNRNDVQRAREAFDRAKKYSL